MVRSGKGAKNRAVPLPAPLLERLRRYWKVDRPLSERKLLFVSTKEVRQHFAGDFGCNEAVSVTETSRIIHAATVRQA